MKNLLLFMFLGLLPIYSFSQNARFIYAEKMYEQKAYYYASEGYEDVLERKMDSSLVAVRLADSYDKIGNTSKAIEWYRYLDRKGTLNREQYVRLALLERQLANYNRSEALLANYNQQLGASDLVEIYTSGAETVQLLSTDKGIFKLGNNGEIQAVNTNHSEISITPFTDKRMLLSSNKTTGAAFRRIFSWTGDNFYHFYTISVDEQGKLGRMKLVKFPKYAKFHQGPAVYNSATGFIYFTGNSVAKMDNSGRGKNGDVPLKIFRARVVNNKLTELEEMSFNGDNYSSAHPAISQDGKRMYFSSNRPGTLGGMDIYRVELNANGQAIGEPVNLGPAINTSSNEVFPSYNDAENLLFFSSEGHFGLGGYDVFVSRLDKQGNARKPENLGVPINSERDDISFTSSPDQKKGYFSSNRTGGKGSDDVYHFTQLVAFRNGSTVRGLLRDAVTMQALANASLVLIDSKGNVIDSVRTNESGQYAMDVKDPDETYELLSSKDGYLTKSDKFKIDNNADEVEENVDLMPKYDYFFVGKINEKTSGEAISEVKVTITDKIKASDAGLHYYTNEDGTFRSEAIGYNYNDRITYNIRLEKQGYLTKNVTIKDVLNTDAEININDYMVIDMTRVVIGQTDLGDVVKIQPIYFDLNSFEIRGDAAVELDKIVLIMKENPTIIVELRSHSDSRGSDELNLSLSDRRAKASAAYVVSKGIARDRIVGTGYGETQLIYTDADILSAPSEAEREQMHQKNRRTEFIIIGG